VLTWPGQQQLIGETMKRKKIKAAGQQSTLQKISKLPEIVHLGNHVYELQYDKKLGRERYFDITLDFFPKPEKIYGWKKIDRNKLTQPVLDKAKKEANKLRREAKKKGDIQKLKELDNYSRKIEKMPIWMVPIRMDLLLRWLAIRRLKINSTIGAQLIADAYNQYYNLNSICVICGRKFAQKSTGRPAKYCKPACKQKAYRRRNSGTKSFCKNSSEKTTPQKIGDPSREKYAK